MIREGAMVPSRLLPDFKKISSIELDEEDHFLDSICNDSYLSCLTLCLR